MNRKWRQNICCRNMDEWNNFRYEWGNLSRYNAILYINYRSIAYFSPFALFLETNVWHTCILNSYIFHFHIHLFQIKYICYKYDHTKNHRSQWKSAISLRFICISNLDESFKNVFPIIIIIISDKLHHVIIFSRRNVLAQLPEVLSNPT